MFAYERYTVFFLFCSLRVLLLEEVLKLWQRIWQVIWQVSGLFSLTSSFFLIFSLLAYAFEKVEEK